MRKAASWSRAALPPSISDWVSSSCASAPLADESASAQPHLLHSGAIFAFLLSHPDGRSPLLTTTLNTKNLYLALHLAADYCVPKYIKFRRTFASRHGLADISVPCKRVWKSEGGAWASLGARVACRYASRAPSRGMRTASVFWPSRSSPSSWRRIAWHCAGSRSAVQHKDH